jgi:hypothetical protein
MVRLAHGLLVNGQDAARLLRRHSLQLQSKRAHLHFRQFPAARQIDA